MGDMEKLDLYAAQQTRLTNVKLPTRTKRYVITALDINFMQIECHYLGQQLDLHKLSTAYSIPLFACIGCLGFKLPT